MNKFFNNIGNEIQGVLNLTAGEASSLLNDNSILVDIRKSYETDYKKFDVKNFLLIPKNLIQDEYNNIPKDKAVIVADSTGLSSKKAVVFLQEKGYKNVANLSGGIMDWERNGFPVTTDKNEALAKPYFFDSKPKNFVKTTLVKKNDK